MRELIDKVRNEDLTKSDIYFVPEATNGSRRPKIGEPLPDFALRDINGNEVTAEDIRGRKTLAVFWSLTCPHCAAMMSDLKAWNDSRVENDPQLIVFSDGAVDDHKDVGIRAPVVLDPGYKTSEKLGMFGTPSAVVVDEHGRIASETGVGATNIWALVHRKPKGTG
jgi:peroxiredoxin